MGWKKNLTDTWIMIVILRNWTFRKTFKSIHNNEINLKITHNTTNDDSTSVKLNAIYYYWLVHPMTRNRENQMINTIKQCKRTIKKKQNTFHKYSVWFVWKTNCLGNEQNKMDLRKKRSSSQLENQKGAHTHTHTLTHKNFNIELSRSCDK